MDISTTSNTIKLNLPAGIRKNIKIEADRIGISLQDFIRMLLASYFSRSEGITNISRNKFLLERAKREITANKVKTVSSKKELRDYLYNL